MEPRWVILIGTNEILARDDNGLVMQWDTLEEAESYAAIYNNMYEYKIKFM
jgi:hypothetical protein